MLLDLNLMYLWNAEEDHRTIAFSVEVGTWRAVVVAAPILRECRVK